MEVASGLSFETTKSRCISPTVFVLSFEIDPGYDQPVAVLNLIASLLYGGGIG